MVAAVGVGPGQDAGAEPGDGDVALQGCVVVAVKAVVTWMFRFRRSIQHKYRIRLPLSFGAARLAFDPRKGEPWRFFISGMHCDLHFNFPGFTGVRVSATCLLWVALSVAAVV